MRSRLTCRRGARPTVDGLYVHEQKLHATIAIARLLTALYAATTVLPNRFNGRPKSDSSAVIRSPPDLTGTTRRQPRFAVLLGRRPARPVRSDIVTMDTVAPMKDSITATGSRSPRALRPCRLANGAPMTRVHALTRNANRLNRCLSIDLRPGSSSVQSALASTIVPPRLATIDLGETTNLARFREMRRETVTIGSIDVRRANSNRRVTTETAVTTDHEDQEPARTRDSSLDRLAHLIANPIVHATTSRERTRIAPPATSNGDRIDQSSDSTGKTRT